MPEKLTCGTFAPHVNQKFRVVLDGSSLDLVLTEAEKSRSPMSPSGREPFTLLFRGPGSVMLEQRIYTFEHETIGSLDIFIVPVGREGDDLLYEAVFN